MACRDVWNTWPSGLRSPQNPPASPSGFVVTGGPRAMYFTHHGKPWLKPIVNFNREALYHGIEFNGAIMIGIQNLSIRFKCQRTLYFFYPNYFLSDNVSFTQKPQCLISLGICSFHPISFIFQSGLCILKMCVSTTAFWPTGLCIFFSINDGHIEHIY